MPVWMEGEEKSKKSGNERKSVERRDVTDFRYLEDRKKFLLWSLTHQ